MVIKDVIERTRMFADVENTNFISDKEMAFLFNENYIKLYQKLINDANHFYSKSFLLETSITDLPVDFYQLELVSYKSNGSLIQRYNNGNSKKEVSYDIIGNQLILYGSINPKEVLINYWTKPVKIKETDLGDEPEIFFIETPNTFFDSLLSIYMAIAIKCKQNADINYLLTQKEEYEIIFFDTLSQDINENIRIKNIYGRY